MGGTVWGTVGGTWAKWKAEPADCTRENCGHTSGHDQSQHRSKTCGLAALSWFTTSMAIQGVMKWEISRLKRREFFNKMCRVHLDAMRVVSAMAWTSLTLPVIFKA